MNTKARIVLMIALVLLAGAALAAVAWAAPRYAPLAPGGSPTVVAYQGEVQVGGTPYAGNGYFKFAVVNAPGTITYWSNDGTSTGGSEPTAAVQLTVSEGLFGVLLGDTSLGGMSQPLTANVFSQPDRTLRVWFSSDNVTFDQLTPDTRIAAVPYALQAQEAVDADTVDGLHASELGIHYQNVVVVAKSGGDYTSVQAAISSITDAAADNAYLVWVAPGVYSETVTMKPYVHLQGAGQEATVITSTASSDGFSPSRATLVLTQATSLRDLTLGNGGTEMHNAALMAPDGTTRTLVTNVTARATQDAFTNNYAIYLTGSDTSVTLQNVTALAEDGDSLNCGLYNTDGATVVLRGGTFIGRGGTSALGIRNNVSATLEATGVTALGENSYNISNGLQNNSADAVLHGGFFTGRGGNGACEGIYSEGSGSTLEITDVTALGENGHDFSCGLYNNTGTVTILRGGFFTGRGGNYTWGIRSSGSGTMLDAEGVTALSENGGVNSGLWNDDNSQATLRGGAFTGREGAYAYGIHNAGSDTTLDAESVTALGQDGSTDTFGLNNSGGGAATLRGGSFTARGDGTNHFGVQNGGDATLEAEDITARGEGGSFGNYGLNNDTNAVAVLRGGSFTARGGDHSVGVQNVLSSMLTAEGITALGENGSSYNDGLSSTDGVTTTLRGGSFTGRGGTAAQGIGNFGITTTLEAANVTALGEDGSINNFGLVNSGGTAATLHGGSFTGRGGSIDAYGIGNSESGTTLEAEGITALGENCTTYNFGLNSYNGAQAMLRNSSFTGRGGQYAQGIGNSESGTTLKAENVTALAENGSDENCGLLNHTNAEATLRGGAFTARTGVTNTHGIRNESTLEAESITALAENGSNNYGLYNLSGTAKADNSQFTGGSNGLYLDSGTVYLGVSQLDGGAINSSGTLTCFQVYDGSYNTYTCP